MSTLVYETKTTFLILLAVSYRTYSRIVDLSALGLTFLDLVLFLLGFGLG